LLWYQKTLPSNPSIYLRFLKIKDLLFTIFSIDGELDYVTMLLAFCKDDCSITGLIKAVSLRMDHNIMFDQNNSSSCSNENDLINFPIETLYTTLIICLKNYMVIFEMYYVLIQ